MPTRSRPLALHRPDVSPLLLSPPLLSLFLLLLLCAAFDAAIASAESSFVSDVVSRNADVSAPCLPNATSSSFSPSFISSTPSPPENEENEEDEEEGGLATSLRRKEGVLEGASEVVNITVPMANLLQANATFHSFIFEAKDDSWADNRTLEEENDEEMVDEKEEGGMVEEDEEGEMIEEEEEDLETNVEEVFEDLEVPWTPTDLCLVIVKAVVMLSIIAVSVLGNVLVIVSVTLHRRLHSRANYLLVSLATADMLVALCAMTFNASVELSGGRWLFGRVMCDLWNSFDVYFSTVSILHLCCISVDRYYAIVRPLEYPLTITRRVLAAMLAHCWMAPSLISFLPIFLGWYTTAAHLRERDAYPHVCAFVVNAPFALVSSAMSFWVPCTVMVVMYYRIFQEARKQERALLERASSSCSASAAYSNSVRLSAAHQQQQEATMARQQLLVALQSTTPFTTPAHRQQDFLMKTLSDTSSSTASVATTSSGVPSVPPSGSSSSRSSSGGGGGISGVIGAWRYSRHGSTASWHGPSRHGSLVPGAGAAAAGRRLHSTPVVLTNTRGEPAPPPPMAGGRREHKAARTLGLIMGAFVLCWLPFFTWYVTINICGPSCRCPHAVVTALFWIGYFNSTLNPFIYAYFRTDFREAFHKTLKRITCCRPRQPSGVFV